MNLLCLAGAAALVLGAAAVGHGQTFVRAGGGWLDFHDSRYRDHTAGSVAIGTVVGSSGSHEFSLQLAHSDWRYADVPPPNLFGTATTRGAGTLQPILANYGYRFGATDAKVHLRIGPSFGFSHASGDVHRVRPLAPPHAETFGSYSQWLATWGGSVAIEFRVTPQFAVEGGIQALVAHGPETTLRPLDPNARTAERAQLENMTSGFVSLGLTWRF